ncbi:hypothetical protein [Pseudosulfitobacter sp. DSM 107133]|nr:hypothetical protein [Pseudosulfitobacter sp. DSM 107133]UOA26371.1 hypothetical protein DSM107133_01071 [Pseudosulfitobacter sp. DSM 107133]
MSKNIILLALFGFTAVVAACAREQQEEFLVVDPEPISVEPTYTGKYK